MTTAVSDLSNLSDRFGSVDEESLCSPLVVSAATLETKRAAADALAVVMNRRREELSVSLVSISLLALPRPRQGAERFPDEQKDRSAALPSRISRLSISV